MTQVQKEKPRPRHTKVLENFPPAETFGSEGCVAVVVQGEEADRGKTLRMRDGCALLGAADDCDMQLIDPNVSSRHARLTVTDDGVLVEDLNSTNGTFYFGSSIERAHVYPGAQLRLGTTLVALFAHTDEDEDPKNDGEGHAIARYGRLLGVSVAMRRLFSVLERLEQSEVSVLIIGETGTGKEVVSRTVHEESRRAKGPFVVLDCAAIPGNLVESEVFGHVKGSFTGASQDRAGVFERADGGTLFIDEIGELPLELQSRFLRLLEQHEVKRVGGNNYKPVDVRVISATHRDLVDATKSGSFRQDLYYRLAVVQLNIPALRERTEDIPILAHHFADEMGISQALPEQLLDSMANYPWPGNLRELRNVVQRVLSLGTLDPDLTSPPMTEVSPSIDPKMPYKEARERVVAEFEKAYIRGVLEHHDGNISKAARGAGIARNYFKTLMRKHRLYGQK